MSAEFIKTAERSNDGSVAKLELYISRLEKDYFETFYEAVFFCDKLQKI